MVSDTPTQHITPQHWRLNRFIWLSLFIFAFIDVVWAAALGWSVDYRAMATIGVAISPFLLGLLIFKRWYKEPRFELMMHVFTQLVLLVFVSAMLNYVTTTIALPMQDEALIAFDRAVGFDWLAYVTWARNSPTLATLFTFAYATAWGQCLLAVALLFMAGRFLHLQRFIFTVYAGAIVSVILAALIPAIAGYVYFDIDPTSLPGDNLPAAGKIHAEHYFMLRDGLFNHVDFSFRGLITFPSYHTSFGVLLIYAFWPFIYLRVPIIALNLLLIMSTPVDGGHYLADVIGGIIVALGVIYWARKLPRAEKHVNNPVSPVDTGSVIK